MSEEANSGSGRRRRRRGRRRGGKGGGGGGGGNSGGNPGNNRGNQQQRRRKPKTPADKFGGRDPVQEGLWEAPERFTAFELFSAYHLGIYEDNNYRDPSIKQTARLFGRPIDQVRNALAACGLDDDTVKKTGFDLSLARLDVKVAPVGIDKKEVAKTLFEEFAAEHPGLIEDWVEPAEAADEEE